jgi:colicin import membrane protein
MSRLHKKCLIVSVGLHLLLGVILLVGPAFLCSKSKSDDLPVIDFIPDKFIDAPFVKANGHARPQPITPQPPPPAPAPQVAEKPTVPDPPKVTSRTQRTEADSFETKAEPKHHLPQISTTLVTRNSDSKKTSKANTATTDPKTTERQLADQRRQLLKQFTRAAENIRDGTSSATEIESVSGNDNSPAYANYAAWVKTVYENAWQAPDDAATSDAITKVSVTIGSDGTVISSRITRPSGDSPVDRSVQRTLERVTFIGPFPDGAKEKQRTYIINFNLRAKRGLA